MFHTQGPKHVVIKQYGINVLINIITYKGCEDSKHILYYLTHTMRMNHLKIQGVSQYLAKAIYIYIYIYIYMVSLCALRW